MIIDDIRARSATGVDSHRLEADEVIVAKMVEMETLDQFHNLCQANRLGQMRQLRLINDHALDCYSPQFCEQLLDHRDTILRNLSRLRIEGLASAPRHDLMPPSAAGTSGATPAPQAPTEIRSFCLTPAGDRLSNDQWDTMLRGMVALGHLPPDAVEGYKILLGLTRRGRSYRPLQAPVPFLTSKKTLAFWVAMMYGTHSYTVDRPMRYDKGVLPSGVYRCEPLIVVPGGRGPDAEGRTRDPYWQLLQQGVSLPASRRSASPSNPMTDLHSFTTALRPPLDYPTAIPILALLRPIGCTSSTTTHCATV